MVFFLKKSVKTYYLFIDNSWLFLKKNNFSWSWENPPSCHSTRRRRRSRRIHPPIKELTNSGRGRTNANDGWGPGKSLYPPRLIRHDGHLLPREKVFPLLWYVDAASPRKPCSNDRCPWDRKPWGGMKVRNVNQVGVHSRNHNHQPSKKITTSK